MRVSQEFLLVCAEAADTHLLIKRESYTLEIKKAKRAEAVGERNIDQNEVEDRK
jgi:hypothetical protein